MYEENKNHTVKELKKYSKIIVQKEILNWKSPKRGIYGIFIDDKCIYIGKSQNIYQRMFGNDGHITTLLKLSHWIDILNTAFITNIEIEFKILKEIPYNFDDGTEFAYNKDLNNLALEELLMIKKYQDIGQCVYQKPEGRHISYEEWLIVAK